MKISTLATDEYVVSGNMMRLAFSLYKAMHHDLHLIDRHFSFFSSKDEVMNCLSNLVKSQEYRALESNIASDYTNSIFLYGSNREDRKSLVEKIATDNNYELLSYDLKKIKEQDFCGYSTRPNSFISSAPRGFEQKIFPTLNTNIPKNKKGFIVYFESLFDLCSSLWEYLYFSAKHGLICNCKNQKIHPKTVLITCSENREINDKRRIDRFMHLISGFERVIEIA